MVSTTDELISEISVKHGISLSHDDPILILQTINARLIRDNVKAQDNLLHQYKEELEEIYLRWGNEAKEKAEKILNASLSASKEAMANLLTEGAEKTAIILDKKVSFLLSQAAEKLNNTKKIALINLTASIVTFSSIFSLIVRAVFQFG